MTVVNVVFYVLCLISIVLNFALFVIGGSWLSLLSSVLFVVILHISIKTDRLLAKLGE